MADFASGFWSVFITVGTVFGIVFCFALIWWLGGEKRTPGEKVETMGHVWDEDLAELNNPLPRWWLYMFYITLIFGIVYLLVYPGLGSFAGAMQWTQKKQYEEEIADANAKYGPLFDQHLKTSIEDLGKDEKALRMGERLFASYCTTCHGSDARGVRGFPNLTDNDWLWGGTPADIKKTILDGRVGNMPPWKDALGGDEGVQNVAQYVLSLSGRKVDADKAAAGKQQFAIMCAACHMPDGTGNPALGAPNLTDKVWLHGGSRRTVEESIANGRSGEMPAHREFLGEAKVHLLTAYIYHLGR